MAIKTPYEVYDIMSSNTDAFTLSARDKSGVLHTIATPAEIKKYFITKYGTRIYNVISGQTASDSYARQCFFEDFTFFINSRQHNIDMMYQAMNDYLYSPIENTDRYEVETINNDKSYDYGKKTNTNISGSDSASDSHGGSDELRLSGSDTTEHKKAGFNAPNTYTADSQTTETKGHAETTTYNTNDTHTGESESLTNVAESGRDTSAEDITRELHTHGNIGVTTNTELINAEIELRKKSVVNIILDLFINEYTYYS